MVRKSHTKEQIVRRTPSPFHATSDQTPYKARHDILLRIINDDVSPCFRPLRSSTWLSPFHLAC